MGCDIHLFTERNRTINNIKIWTNSDNWILNPYFGTDLSEKKYNINTIYKRRNYSLFSILANVRNESENKPISMPKGMPKDVSDAIKKESEIWNGDGHSHSYFTMKELYDYQEKNKTIKYSGLVDKEGLEQIKKGNMPEWSCGMSTRTDLTWMEWEHESDVLKNFIEKLENHFYESFYYDKDVDQDNYRIVFWFDN